MSGRIVLGDNAVLEGFDIDGYIEVAGDNVTIRRGRVRASATTPGWGLIEIRGNNATIEDVELDGNNGVGSNGVWVHDSQGGGYSATRLDVHGLSADAFKVLGPVVLDGIWAHSRYALSASAHADAVQLQSYRADGRLVVRCANLDWGIPPGFGPSDVRNGSISGGQGIWLADHDLPVLEISQSRVVAVGYTFGLRASSAALVCGVQARSDMGWGIVHPGVGNLSAGSVAWDVVDIATGASVPAPSPMAIGC